MSVAEASERVVAGFKSLLTGHGPHPQWPASLLGSELLREWFKICEGSVDKEEERRGLTGALLSVEDEDRIHVLSDLWCLFYVAQLTEGVAEGEAIVEASRELYPMARTVLKG